MTKNSRTTESLLARRALAEKATPGPWVKGITIGRGYAVDAIWDCNGTLVANIEFSDSTREESNIGHITANSPDVVMADIDEIIRLREENARLKDALDNIVMRLREISSCGVDVLILAETEPEERARNHD